MGPAGQGSAAQAARVTGNPHVPLTVAHIDEGGIGGLAGGARLCGLVASLSSSADRGRNTAALRSLLLPGRPYLHHYDETRERRAAIARVIAGIVLHGAVVVTKVATDQQQEQARRRLHTSLLPCLQWTEGADRAVIESRGGSDKLDRRTCDGLRRARLITVDMRVDFARKSEDELLWVADFVAGSYFDAWSGRDPEPWKIVSESQQIDVWDLDAP